MLKNSFSPWPYFSEEEIKAVETVLRSNKVNYWTGEECKMFEKEFASFVGVDYAVSLANGTVAIDAALLALGVGPGDEVIVTSRTFLASVTSIVNIGAIPVFSDVDRETQNISALTIASCISNRTKAIICVHLAGWPCDMDPIMELAKKNNLFVVEDCAQAHGARYKGKSVGSIGDIGCWSFCQDKIITTGGEGGMITTNQYGLWSFIWSYKDHGKSYDAINKKNISFGFQWFHETFGTNWRMTEMQAAIGRVQLRSINEWNKARICNAKKIWSVAENIEGIRVPSLRCTSCEGNCCNSNSCVHAAYKCYVFVEKGQKFRDQLITMINSKGVPCYSGSCPEVYLEKAFNLTPFKPKNRLRVAKELGETSLMFLCHPTLKRDEIQKTCDVLVDCNIKLML